MMMAYELGEVDLVMSEVFTGPQCRDVGRCRRSSADKSLAMSWCTGVIGPSAMM
jgi:hypothetical protein